MNRDTIPSAKLVFTARSAIIDAKIGPAQADQSMPNDTPVTNASIVFPVFFLYLLLFVI